VTTVVLAGAEVTAPWALAVAVAGFVVSAIVGVYSAHTARRSARENAQLAAWPLLVTGLQTEVDRLHARVAELERRTNGGSP